MKKLLLSIILLLSAHFCWTQVKIHPDLTANNSIEYYEISPDGSKIVFVADLDTDDVFELYSVSISGGTPTKISGTLVDGGDVSFNSLRRFQISPDSQTVVFTADKEIDNVLELYSVPVDGGTVTKLNGTLAGADGVRSFQISPNGQIVVYVADELDNFDDELYSVSIGGGSSIKLSQSDLGIGDVNLTFHISADSQWVVYVANADDASDDELYSVPIGGGTIHKLNGTLVSGGDVVFNKVLITPDSQNVVYIADQDTNFVEELYTTPIGGGTSVKLNTALASNSEDVDRAFISPDSQRVVYVAGNSTTQFFEIYSVNIDGSGAVKLNGSEIDDDNPVSLRTSVQISPDSQIVVYFVNTTTDSAASIELFSVPIDGSSNSLRISGEINSFEFGVFDAQISPDGQHVIYISEEEGGVNADIELYTVPIEGGTIVKLNSDLGAGGDVTDFRISPDGQNVFYRADQDANEVFEIYVVSADGSGTSRKMNGSLTTNGDTRFAFTSDNSSSFEGTLIDPNNQYIVYIADQDINNTFELYSVHYSNILSTDNFTTNAIDLYNLSGGDIIVTGVENSKVSIDIYSILGSQLFSTNFTGNGINRITKPDIRPGIYIVKLATENGTFVTKKMVFD